MERMLRKCNDSELASVGKRMGIMVEGKSKKEILHIIRQDIDKTDEGGKEELLTSMISYLPAKYKDKIVHIMIETLLADREEMTPDASRHNVNATELTMVTILCEQQFHLLTVNSFMH